MDVVLHEKTFVICRSVSEFEENVVAYEFTIRLYAPFLNKVVDFGFEFRCYPLGEV